MLSAFTCGLLHGKLSRAFSENLDSWKAALIKPILEGKTALIKSVLEGDHLKEGLALKLPVQTLFGPASVRWIIAVPLPCATTITAKVFRTPEQAGQTLVVVGHLLSTYVNAQILSSHFPLLPSALTSLQLSLLVQESIALEPERITHPHACLTCLPAAAPGGDCQVQDPSLVWILLGNHFAMSLLHMLGLIVYIGQVCAVTTSKGSVWVRPALHTHNGSSLLLKQRSSCCLGEAGSSITFRHRWMSGPVGFLLWAVIQGLHRSCFNKQSWLLIPPETEGFRLWTTCGSDIHVISCSSCLHYLL